ncbi:MAG: hypothetical protein KAS67_01515 [Thermoplasmata archaeon]|nr:hypothetical protein [Thermoplasmata archaeon]
MSFPVPVTRTSSHVSKPETVYEFEIIRSEPEPFGSIPPGSILPMPTIAIKPLEIIIPANIKLIVLFISSTSVSSHYHFPGFNIMGDLHFFKKIISA